ncbi:non-ribosomal peptide synthetase [Dactylosporangium sp. NPDC050688]|uniref:non-ribosomal peptide synthetase n=1 Tax=Dactylosporangium sp. NPDC050688 TaxID=3157217 RepID=UPI0033ECFA8F
MLRLPSHLSGRGGGTARQRTWDAPGWSRLCRAAPDPAGGPAGSPASGAPAARLLAGLLAVLVHRYGAPCRLSADPGCGSPGAARVLLDADPLTVTWADVLAEVTTGSPDPAAAHLPAMHVTTGPDAAPSADLLWSAGPDGITARWDPGVYPDTTVATIAGHLGRLAEQLSAPDAAPLAGLDILTAAERVINGGTPAALPAYPPITLHQLFMLQAWRTPDADALVMDEDRLTYRELDQASNRLAHRLVEAGVRPGDAVGVGGERCLGLFVALIAVLKAGGVFVYLDPVFPAGRQRQFLDVSGVRLLLSGPGAVPLETGLPQLAFPAVPQPDEPGARGAPDVLVGAESPAYILFTSGSTGTPKGVLRPHRLHTSRIFLEQGMYRLGASDRHLLKMTISAREVFWPLCTGGTAVVARPGGERDDRYLAELIDREGITVMSAVPSMLQALAANPTFARCRTLRHLFVGGEALHRGLEERVRSFGVELHNTYTLTEADYVTHRQGAPVGVPDDVSVIGTPLDMRVYLCDEHGRLVPPGLPGEIWTGGPGLADGYHGDPERTAQRFVPNPFGDPMAPVLFRTGDLARHLPDGSLEYRGRADLQVKVRGQRVEPTEVESWIVEHPQVHQAAVVGYPDPEQGAVLVAFVVSADPSLDERGLRAFLAERIPAFMVPRHFARVVKLPQLSSGKIDRASLRLPQRARPEGLPAAAPARTATQHGLVRVWRRILQLPDIGVDDDYTALGGDSLRVLLLRAAIEDEFGVAVDLAALLAAPTIRAQERLVDGGPEGAGDSGQPPADHGAAAASAVARRADHLAARAAAAGARDRQPPR